MEKSEFLFPLLLDGYQSNPSEEEMEELRQAAVSCGLIGEGDMEMYRFVVLVTNISDGEQDRTSRASVQAIDTILKKYVRYASCFMRGRVVSVLAATERGFSKYLHIIVDEIVQSVRRIMNMQGTVGVSRSTEHLENCAECYREAMNALSYSWQKESDVHFIADEEHVEPMDFTIMDNTVSKIEELLRGGSVEELKQFLDAFSARIASGEIQPAAADFLVAQIMAAGFKVFYAVAGERAVENLQEHLEFHGHTMVEQVMASFEKCATFCIDIKEKISEQRKKSGEVFCDRALEIIEERYYDPELSVVTVSGEIGVSPNYLSALIKKTTDSTFVELLTKKRIEKAKELLLCTSKKIREITEECGYRDQHYFSYCFKRATGVSPNQCRKDAGGM